MEVLEVLELEILKQVKSLANFHQQQICHLFSAESVIRMVNHHLLLLVVEVLVMESMVEVVHLMLVMTVEVVEQTE